MEFQYDLSPDDYAAWSRHLRGPKGTIRQPVRSRLIMPGIAAAWALYSYSVRGHFTPFDLGLLATVIVFEALFPKWLAHRAERRIRAQAQANSTAGLVGQHELVVDDAGVTQRSPFGAYKRLWPGVQRVEETATHLFIFYDQQAAFIVPKSRLGDAADTLRHAVEEGIRRATPE